MDTIYDWNEIKGQLEHDIQIWYVKDPDINRKREMDKERTIKWIIDRMKQGPEPTGTRIRMPDFTFTFGATRWQGINHAMRILHPKCAFCGAPSEEIHHIRPREIRGTDHPRNLIALCKDCHDELHRRYAHNMDVAIWMSINETSCIMRDKKEGERWRD